MSIFFVLHQPQDLVNIAATVRVMKNFGFRDLRLVAPAEYDTRRIQGIAHKTGDVLKRVRQFDTLDEALADCNHVVGLTARGRTAKRNVLHLREATAEILQAAGQGRVALVFGREDKGLSNQELDRCHRTVTVPANPEHSSLNLGHAVCITAYELFLAQGDLPAVKRPRNLAPAAKQESLELLFGDAQRALETIEFYKTRNPDVVMRTVREVVHRVPTDEREVKLLRAMFIEVVRFIERKGLK